MRNDAITKFCLEVLKQARPIADFSASEAYAKLDPAYGRFFWMADGDGAKLDVVVLLLLDHANGVVDS